MSQLKYEESWIWGAILILVAIMALVIIGWRGLEGQREVVWEEARLMCEEMADQFEEQYSFSEEYPGDLLKLYPDAPQPGTFSFDPSATSEDLERLTTSEEYTLAGLPVSVLASYELFKRTGSVNYQVRTRRLAVENQPSVITPIILKKIGKDDDGGWAVDEQLRRLIKESGGTRQMFLEESTAYWIKQVDKERYRFHQTMYPRGEVMTPRWAGLEIVLGHQSIDSAGKVLVRRPFMGGELLVGAIDPQAIEWTWRSQRDWTIMIGSVAALAVGLGFWIIMRGVLREKNLAHAKSQFVASVTHELRAPVGSMRLMADALNAGKMDTEKVGRFHRLLSRESGRLSVLIENVMDLARVEDGRRVIHPEQISMEAFVTEAIEMMTPLAEDQGVILKAKGDAEKFQADPVALRQILVNLIDNAIKFSPKGGMVSISWKEGDSLTVSDQGPGVAEHLRERIFERFYRAEDELRRETKGVGIGLSLVKNLVELHLGHVSVVNDHGAVFKIIFPKP